MDSSTSDETGDSPRVAFQEMLAHKDLQGLGWILGQLAVHTAENLAKLTEDERQSTLTLIPAKRLSR